MYRTAMDATNPDLQQASRLFQALSDETRLRIVQMLSGGERCVCDLQEAVGAYQSRLSFHLKKLKDAGLVSDRREGRWVYYTLRAEALEEMRSFLTEVEPAEASWSSPAQGRCRS
jgi:ArsR family transcriptional regulator